MLTRHPLLQPSARQGWPTRRDRASSRCCGRSPTSAVRLTWIFSSDLPLEEARSWLMKFKGVGPKTAAIVLLFSLGRPAFPVDTHIYRVTGRIGLRPEKMTVEDAHVHLEKLFPPEAYYAAHLNIIRLGREICAARKPACERCPLRGICNYAIL